MEDKVLRRAGRKEEEWEVESLRGGRGVVERST